MLRSKWRSLTRDPALLRRINAYLDLELAAAHYFAGSRVRAACALASSYLNAPRLSLHLSPGWTMERRASSLDLPGQTP